MKLSVPFNGKNDLIPALGNYPEVREIYGKTTADFVGGGKHSFQTLFISKRKITDNIRKAHNQGLEFNYLLNSSCLENKEFTLKGRGQIIRLIQWMKDIGVDSVTVSSPYIFGLIKKYFPEAKIQISTLAGVNSVEKARYWQELGAQAITLLNLDTNRDFPLLKKIRAEINCQLKLIVNANCLHKCPAYRQHANSASHASQLSHRLRGFIIDYCRIQCRYNQLMNPLNFIRSTWIRPEDVACYEELGIDYFKIIDRGMSTQRILSIVKSYTDRSFQGNLLDLFPCPVKNGFSLKEILQKLRFFFRPFKVNVFKLRKLAGLIDNCVYIDNKKLDGFMEKLIRQDCSSQSCQDCAVCGSFVQKAVNIRDPLRHKIIQENYRDCLESIISGDMFKYFK